MVLLLIKQKIRYTKFCCKYWGFGNLVVPWREQDMRSEFFCLWFFSSEPRISWSMNFIFWFLFSLYLDEENWGVEKSVVFIISGIICIYLKLENCKLEVKVVFFWKSIFHWFLWLRKHFANPTHPPCKQT